MSASYAEKYARQDMSFSFSENQWGEKYVEEINRSDFLNVQSGDLFDQVLDFKLQDENCLFIISGSDSGLLLPWLYKQKIGRGSRLVIVELDEVYALVAPAYRGLLAVEQTEGQSRKQIGKDQVAPPPITLHKFSTWQDEVFDGTDDAWFGAGTVNLVESHASSTDYARLYTSMHRAIKKSIELRRTALLTQLNHEIFSKMQFRNAVDSTKAFKAIPDLGDGKTAVVLGGGPSLDQHIDWIKENREKLFILAVSRISNKLIKEELKPDIVVSVDPFDICYEISKQGILWTDVPLAYNYHLTSKLLQQWQGPAFYLGKRLPWHSIEDMPDYVGSSGPTVSHTAVVVASSLGFSTVLMTGVDLCFSATASTHAGESPEQMLQKMPTLCNAQVKTYSGRTAGTGILLKNSVDALEEIGAHLKEKNIQLYNLNEEAAYCPSIEHIDTSNVELPDNKPNLADYIDLEVHEISEKEIDDLEREFKLAKHTLLKICSICTKAKTLVEQIHGGKVHGSTAKISSKLARLRKQMETEYPGYLDAITYHYGRAFSKIRVPTDFSDMSAEELVQWGQLHYKLIERSARSLMTEIDAQMPRIQLRRDEKDNNADIRELVKRWREDETPGRILRWKRLHWSNVKPEDRAWLQRTIGKFRATLNTTSKAQSQQYRSSNEDIDNVLKSLVFLMENQSISELQAIESRLDSSIWPYSALKSYTAGLVQVLSDERVSALNHFQLAIEVCTTRMDTHPDSTDSMKRLIEECLVRMTSCYMSLGDYQSATTTLGMLCEMLPSYVVSYAKMLDLSGQQEFAIELLQSYLELYPSDKKAQFLLNKLAPEPATEEGTELPPEYKDKINNAMQAIMGQ